MKKLIILIALTTGFVMLNMKAEAKEKKPRAYTEKDRIALRREIEKMFKITTIVSDSGVIIYGPKVSEPLGNGTVIVRCKNEQNNTTPCAKIGKITQCPGNSSLSTRTFEVYDDDGVTVTTSATVSECDMETLDDGNIQLTGTIASCD